MQAIKLKFTLTACLVASAFLTAPVFAQDAVQTKIKFDASSMPSTDKNTRQALEQRVQPFLLSDNALTQYHAQKA